MNLPILTLGDIIAFSSPPGLFFGRIANFVNGELWGRQTSSFWGIAFSKGGGQFCPDNQSSICLRHPSQLYEATLEGLLLMAIFFILVYGFKALKKPGLIFATFLIGYGLIRFFIEFVREADSFFVNETNPHGHVIQITLVCFGLGVLFQKYPMIQFYLKWICFFYLLFLGWKILGSLSDNEKKTGRPLRFYEAALFQFINPKAWVVAITAATAFFPNEENFIVATSFVAITAPFVCFPSICIWAAFGASIKSIIKNICVNCIAKHSIISLYEEVSINISTHPIIR